MRPVLLTVVTVSLLWIFASISGSERWIGEAQKKPDCGPKGCLPALPWIDFDPACCPKKEKPYHYYQRENRDKVGPEQVRCYESLTACGTTVTRDKVVDRKPGCPENPYWRVRDDFMICCTEWDKAVKSGEPCNPAKDPNCDGGSGKWDAESEDPFDPYSFLQKNKPPYVWVSGAGGSAAVYNYYEGIIDKPMLHENNGTMLKVDWIFSSYMRSGGQAWICIKGERAGGTYEGCMHAEDVACDPAKVRK